jgi:hypothetical protein
MNTTNDLRRFAIARSLFPETTLGRAISLMGFVQADPIRAPARAQDLTLRHRVKGYRAGDLERRYQDLPIEEDYFINYGFLPHQHVALMHPRTARHPWDKKSSRRAQEILAFVKEHGRVHPREVDAHFAHGRVKNYWGGSSSATTHLLDGMHYRGMLRVARRELGIRVYEPAATPMATPPTRDERHARADALVAICVKKYAPLPTRTLTTLARHLRYGAPQLAAEIKAAAARAQKSYPRTSADGLDYLWPDDAHTLRALAHVRKNQAEERVRLLAPFDPIVWDRLRFTAFFGWTYKFEAYTPQKARKLGYYALPLLFRDTVVGWGNLKVTDGQLVPTFGYVAGHAPKDPAFARELDLEVDRMRAFLSDRVR